MTSCGIWMILLWTILPWWFLFLLLHFVDEGACGPHPSESLHGGPCYHPWTCWNPPSSHTSAVSLFIWVLLSAHSGLDNSLCNARDPCENGNISSYLAHLVTSVTVWAIWDRVRLWFASKFGQQASPKAWTSLDEGSCHLFVYSLRHSVGLLDPFFVPFNRLLFISSSPWVSLLLLWLPKRPQRSCTSVPSRAFRPTATPKDFKEVLMGQVSGLPI